MTTTSKHFGYFIFGKDMNSVNLDSLKKNGVTDIFLNYYSFAAHGESKVQEWIVKAKNKDINVHIWMQCFYDGAWHNPKTTNLSSKIKEAKKYASMKNVKGVCLDYLRYPGNAYKTSGGAEAITEFVKKIRKENPDTFLSCAIMPEDNGKYYYGQDQEALGKIVDAIIPMQYKGNYHAGTDWLTTTTKKLIQKGVIWSALQSYKSDDNPTLLSNTELLNDTRTCINNGAQGVILFRYGLSSTINFTELTKKEEKTKMTTYKEIVELAKAIKTNVEKNKKFPTTLTINKVEYTYGKMAYLLSNEIVNIGKDVASKSIKNAAKSSGDTINEKIYASDYKDQAKRVAQYIKQHGQCPNYVTTAKSNKKVRPRDFIYAFARILVYYDNNKKTWPNYCTYKSSIYTTTTTTKKTTTTTSANVFTSSPHYTEQGCNKLGQCTPYYCAPHSIHQILKKFGITKFTEAQLASWCGTTTAGTSHNGIETCIATVAKKTGKKLKVKWYNFSDFGSSDSARWKALGQKLAKSNIGMLWHLWYSGAGSYVDDDDACGHYETLQKINLETNYCKALNSLGSRCGGITYCGHLQDRKLSVQKQYMQGISQKSICIISME